MNALLAICKAICCGFLVMGCSAFTPGAKQAPDEVPATTSTTTTTTTTTTTMIPCPDEAALATTLDSLFGYYGASRFSNPDDDFYAPWLDWIQNSEKANPWSENVNPPPPENVNWETCCAGRTDGECERVLA